MRLHRITWVCLCPIYQVGVVSALILLDKQCTVSEIGRNPISGSTKPILASCRMSKASGRQFEGNEKCALTSVNVLICIVHFL